MNELIIGKYVPGTSLIHRLDSRAKLLFIFFYVVVVLLANNGITYALLTVFTCLIALLSKVPISFIMKGLRPLWWIMGFTFLVHLLITKGGEVLVQIGSFSIYEGAVWQGIFISLRFFVLIVVTTLMTLTTTPIEVTDGLESLLHPLKKVKFPVHELALMMSISLRFIPTLSEEADKIMKAQTARGVDFSSGTLMSRLKAIVALLVPLFVSSFKRAEDLATAMEARGYRSGEGRTKFRVLQWTMKDTLSLFVLGIVASILAVLRS